MHTNMQEGKLRAMQELALTHVGDILLHGPPGMSDSACMVIYTIDMNTCCWCVFSFHMYAYIHDRIVT